MYPRGYWMMAYMMNVFKSYQEYSPCALIVLAWLIMTVCAHFYSDVSSLWYEMSRRRHEYWLSKMQCKIKLEPLFADLQTHQKIGIFQQSICNENYLFLYSIYFEDISMPYFISHNYPAHILYTIWIYIIPLS